MVTNTNNEQRQSCINVGLEGNRQGLTKCFDLKTGKVVLEQEFTKFTWLDSMLELVNRGEIKEKCYFQGLLDFHE